MPPRPKNRSRSDRPQPEPQPPSGGELSRQRPLAPDPAAPIPVVHVGFAVRHPLVYRKRIDKVEAARPGDLVAVYGTGEQLLGYGVYNPRSEIAVRMLFAGRELPDDARWQARLRGSRPPAPRNAPPGRNDRRLPADSRRGRRAFRPGRRSPRQHVVGGGLFLGHVPACGGDSRPSGRPLWDAAHARSPQSAVPQPGRA